MGLSDKEKERAIRRLEEIRTSEVMPSTIVEDLGFGYKVVKIINKINGEEIKPSNYVSYDEAIKTAKSPKYSHNN